MKLFEFENDRRKAGLPPKLHRSWRCWWPMAATDDDDEDRCSNLNQCHLIQSKLIYRETQQQIIKKHRHEPTRVARFDGEKYSYSNISDLNYKEQIRFTLTGKSKRATRTSSSTMLSDFSNSVCGLTILLFALLVSLTCATHEPNRTTTNNRPYLMVTNADQLEAQRRGGLEDGPMRYKLNSLTDGNHNGLNNTTNYFANQDIALKLKNGGSSNRFDNISTQSTQLVPSATAVQSLSTLTPPLFSSSTTNQDAMIASASKKKKKMMKKKKKMEKKHKEWKKGKKHKKKKYESKKKKGGMEKKKKGKKEKKKWGMEKKGHKKKGNFKKKKWGHKKKKKKGEKKGKKGHKMLKDKGHKKKGFKKVYHKEEWGKKKKWHDIKREKKWNTKQKKWKKKWQQEKGKKYKGKHMKKYHKKNKHGKKYKKEKKSKYKKHKGEKFKKGHKKKKEEYAKKKEGGKKKKMKKFKKVEKKKKKG